jgi:hypothetical protein
VNSDGGLIGGCCYGRRGRLQSSVRLESSELISYVRSYIAEYTRRNDDDFTQSFLFLLSGNVESLVGSGIGKRMSGG